VEFGGVKLGIAPGDAGIGGVVNVGSVVNSAAGVRGSIRAATISQDANLVMITCAANRPDDAQSLCGAVSESYIQLRSQMERASAEAAAEFLRGQVQEIGKRLAAAEDSLGAYEERNLAVALDQRASSAVNQYSALKLERERFESERTALAGLLREIDQPGGDERKYRDLATFPGFANGGNPVVSRLMQNLIELEDRRSQLAITRTDRNPDIVAIDSRIAEVEQQLRSYSTSYEQSLGKQVSALEGAMGRAQGQLSGIPTKQVASGRLLRQVNLLQENYHFLQTRLREAEVARSVDLPAVQIVDHASLPGGPSSPDVRTNLLLGLLMGLGLGTMIALYREYTDSRIRDRKDVERHTGVRVLGLIPSVKAGGPLLPVANGNGRGLLGGGSKTADQDARGGTRPQTMDAQLAFEAFRSLLMDMGSAGVGGAGGAIRSVAVTSSTRGDGKTFTACNLAIASAAQGRRTLLIDTDLRARGVGRFFKLPWTAPGLIEVLEGQREYQGVLNDLDIIGDHSSLHVLPSGNHEPSMPGLLERMSSQLESLIRDAESRYDLVVVDTPPLNVITDAATIATRADAVLVVVRGGVTDRDALDLTLKRLRLLHTNVLGIVLNDVQLPEYYTSYSVSPEDEV
jgi:tyrosine-protein kinase Etk/Wzc